jgi:protein-L-isoaspartate(D-aspartate) O-methyltransferase
MMRLYFILYILIIFGCNGVKEKKEENQNDRFEQMRHKMVEYQIKARGIQDARVLEVLRRIPRHLFVPESLTDQAYNDEPLPIGSGQTISQPYIVAYMTEQLQLEGTERVLEIGTGSGYQAAVLAELAQRVYSIEILPELSHQAQKVLNTMGYDNIEFKIGNGYFGWPDEAPFDAIIVTAAPEKIPQTLIDQLKIGGRMIIPVGDFFQNLYLVEKKEGGIKKENKLPVRFVPLQNEPKKD